MLFDMTRTRSGNMSPELQAGVDRLIEEFMAASMPLPTTATCRGELPEASCRAAWCILDKEKLSILAQIRSENRFASYFYNPNIALTPQQAANSARWEFGLEDPYIIQFPASLLEHSPDQPAIRSGKGRIRAHRSRVREVCGTAQPFAHQAHLRAGTVCNRCRICIPALASR